MTSTPGVDVATRLGAAIRGEFPIFESATYLNSCSQGALSHRVREAVEGWLAGWDANGAEWDFWVERNEAFRTAIAGLLHADTDDVAVTTSVSQGVSALVSALPLERERNRIVISEYEFPTVGQIAHAQELRGAEVVHVRPDADGAIPAGAVCGGDRRADGACLLHDGLVPLRAPPRRGRDRGRAHGAGALVLADSYQACGAVELDVGALGADVVTGGTVKYLLGTAGSASCGCGRSCSAAAADPDRLVCRRGHLCDVDRRLLAACERAPVRLGHAAGACALRRGRGARAPRRDRRAGRRGACPRSRRASPRGARRARRDRGDAAGAGGPRATRLHTLDRPSPRWSPPSPGSGSSPRCATRTCGSPCTSTTSRRTSTGCSRRYGRHRALLA